MTKRVIADHLLPRWAFIVDIETMDTCPTARVLSVGVAALDLSTFKISCAEFGLAMGGQPFRSQSAETMAWWREQSQFARDRAFSGGMRAIEAFARLAKFAQSYCEDDASTWWGYGPSFDLVVLESLASDFGITPPWTYRQHRDLRTMFSLTGIRPDDHYRSSETKHVAMHDAVAEARALVSSLKALGYEADEGDKEETTADPLAEP